MAPTRATPTPSTSSRSSASRPNKHRRTYRACQACRSAKLRCDLGNPDAPHDPPCRRCLRTGRECFFVGSYQDRSKYDQGPKEVMAETPRVGMPFSSANTGSQPLEPWQAISAPNWSNEPSTEAPFTDQTLLSPTHTITGDSRTDFKFVRGENLENPADALRILCAAAEDDPRRGSADIEDNAPPENGLWNRWVPVRDGLLTAEEAGLLLTHFAQHLSPCHPLVPSQIFEAEYFRSLIREPILLAAFVSASVRYVDLGPSFDATEPSRSRIIQTKLISWLLERIGFIAMGDAALRTIGTVEAFLILSEWPPRAGLLADKQMAHTVPGGTEKRNPCKLYDDLSWTLIGLAVRIAQELSLHDETSYADDGDQPNWMVHRRINTWIYCLSADRHVSVRLGRASGIQEMTTCWWDSVTDITRKRGDQSFPFPRAERPFRESRGVGELTHTIGLLQELLYARPSVTEDLIKTGRFESILHRLKPELDSLWNWHAGDLPSYSVFDSTTDTFTNDELREIRWRIEYDYVRLYANAIAMRASQARLLRRIKTYDKNERVFQANVIRSVEGPFVLEAIDAAISLIRCAVTMQQKSVLRYCPGRTFMRMMFASVFLMKAMSFGAVIQPEQEIVDLQYKLIESFRAASVDDEHIAFHLASLLSRVFPIRPQGNSVPPQETTLDTKTDALGTGPQTLFSFDTMNFDTGLDFDETGLSLNIGYDPNSLVSSIEEMLATSGSQGMYPTF